MATQFVKILKEDATPILNLAESLLASISGIMTAVVCIEKEHENFIEFGCYLYRASLAIMELLKAENSPENAIEILQTLSLNVDLAKDLVKRCQEVIDAISDNELGSIIAQLKGVINNTGESLSLLPSSTFGDQEYVKVAIRSLSNEMQKAQFGIGQTLAVNTKQHDTRTLSLKKQLKEEPAPQETDLYPINVDVSINDHQFLNMPQKIEAVRSRSSDVTRKPGNMNRSLNTLPKATQYMEPLYETFFCPLGKKIMDNPVTIETGVTYERNEITEWFEKFEKSEDIFCPLTGQKLVSRAFNTNKALKSTIEEWLERNEASRIKVARTALSLASSKDMVLEAIKDLQTICQRKRYNKVQVRSVGLMPSLIKFLEYKDRDVRCAAMEEMISKTMNISTIIDMLSSSHQPIRHASLQFLLELSKSLSLCEKIGSVPGGILMLINIKYKHSIDAFASEKADGTLRNLEKVPNNIKHMAECGHLEPLLDHLTEGCEEMKMEMASYLGEIVLGHDSKTFVAVRASPHLLQVNNHGHTITSDYVVYNIFDMLKNSTPDKLNIYLIRIILCLTKTQKSIATIVSVVKTTEASHTLTELINNPHDDLAITTIKLLCTLSPYMGHTLAERLCKTGGQPESLFQSPNEINQITERHAVSAKYVAKLPHQNLTLNLAILSKNAVPTILKTINQIQRSGTRSSRYASAYLEGLVGTLVRFTTTLYEPQILFLARNYNFTSVFTELLIKTSSDEVQRLSAIGLENLSSQSINLSKAPQIKRTKFVKLFYLPKFLSFGSSKRRKLPGCPVHRGACSSQNTFCLVDAKAVERLLACLDHENVEVVEAALSAIITLLDEKVDVDKSVSMLSEVNAVQRVLNLVKEHQQEGLWQKSLWVIDKFLMKGGDKSASDISQDRLLPATLVNAFHHGDGKTREMAEKILRHLNKMPNSSTSNYTM
ncbi:putative u-box domain-containing protein 42 [Quercus suber]|uniref:RING-type E3 ubiquitin transferase n=1 Tax=Quercus suber TaxID=58331 RepID=A0AAW0KBT3_QUESU